MKKALRITSTEKIETNFTRPDKELKDKIVNFIVTHDNRDTTEEILFGKTKDDRMIDDYETMSDSAEILVSDFKNIVEGPTNIKALHSKM